MDVAAALAKLGGLGTAKQLRLLTSKKALRAAVAAGEIVRLRRDLYGLPVMDEAKAAAARVGGVRSHLSAALHWGWKVKFPPAVPSVTVRRGRELSAERRAGVDVHWADLPKGDVVDGVTSKVRTVTDCARTMPFDAALAVADSALRARHVTKKQLIEAAKASPRTGRRAAVRVAMAADGRAANPFESVLRAIALDVPGLSVIPQHPVGPVWHADLADAVLMLAIEAESWEFHGTQEEFRSDIRRYNDFTRLGWRLARFLWEDVMYRPDRVRAVLVDVVALAA